MVEQSTTLFPEMSPKMRSGPLHTTGILPYQSIREMIRNKEIVATADFTEAQVQPASVDLRLGSVAYRVRASFLPGQKSTVQQKIDQYAMHEIDLTKNAVLEKDCVYIVPLMEHLALPSRISGTANPKSSVGRLDIFTRLITDRATEFENVPAGYQGPLYAEISPRTFSILVHQGSRLNQLRFRRGTPTHRASDIHQLHATEGLIDRDLERHHLASGVPLTVDLTSLDENQPIGFRARKHSGLIDLDRISYYDPVDYWEPICPNKESNLVLDPHDFYILASKESVTVPPAYAAEMVAYDTSVGEFRVHYAGFFDPGFGHVAQGAQGTRAVLEVRSHDVPFMIEDGQLVGRLVYERLTDQPDKLYGAAIGSSYQRQGLQLSKQFRPYR